MVVIIPLTSSLEILEKPNTLKITSSKQNGLDKDSVALIFQMRALDARRMI